MRQMNGVTSQNPDLNGVTSDYPAGAFTNDRYMKLARGGCNWQVMAGRFLLSSLALTSDLVYLSSQQQIIPCVMQVEDAVSAAVVEALRASSVVAPRVIQTPLTHWLKDI